MDSKLNQYNSEYYLKRLKSVNYELLQETRSLLITQIRDNSLCLKELLKTLKKTEKIEFSLIIEHFISVLENYDWVPSIVFGRYLTTNNDVAIGLAAYAVSELVLDSNKTTRLKAEEIIEELDELVKQKQEVIEDFFSLTSTQPEESNRKAQNSQKSNSAQLNASASRNNSLGWCTKENHGELFDFYNLTRYYRFRDEKLIIDPAMLNRVADFKKFGKRRVKEIIVNPKFCSEREFNAQVAYHIHKKDFEKANNYVKDNRHRLNSKSCLLEIIATYGLEVLILVVWIKLGRRVSDIFLNPYTAYWISRSAEVEAYHEQVSKYIFNEADEKPQKLDYSPKFLAYLDELTDNIDWEQTVENSINFEEFQKSIENSKAEVVNNFSRTMFLELEGIDDQIGNVKRSRIKRQNSEIKPFLLLNNKKGTKCTRIRRKKICFEADVSHQRVAEMLAEKKWTELNSYKTDYNGFHVLMFNKPFDISLEDLKALISQDLKLVNINYDIQRKIKISSEVPLNKE